MGKELLNFLKNRSNPTKVNCYTSIYIIIALNKRSATLENIPLTQTVSKINDV